jgi:hypothetical protein
MNQQQGASLIIMVILLVILMVSAWRWCAPPGPWARG